MSIAYVLLFPYIVLFAVISVTLALAPMSIIDLRSYAIPYILLLVVCLFVFLVCLVKIPSLRVYRQKRNLLVYTMLVLVLGLIAYRAYDISLGPNYISFEIKKTQTPIYAGKENQFSVTCYSDGVKEAKFYMILKSANATLQVGDQQGYIKVNDTAIKIPFALHGSEEQTKPVYFTAAANVSSLEFYPSIERSKDSQILVMTWLSGIQCTWNPTTHSFVMADSMPLAVP